MSKGLPSRTSAFYKMSGSGNDFIVLDGRETTAEDWPVERIVAVCDRRQGVGADGLVILTPEHDGQVRMTFFNCDGSPAAMCGNAALCSTRLATLLGMAPPEGMRLATAAGTFPTRCLPGGHESELNLPDFDVPREVPGIVRIPGEESIFLATVGVPHLVVLVSDVERIDLMGRGRELRYHPALGGAGANVNFVSPPSSTGGPFPIRTYERGVEGETLACGTGAVAAAAALVSLARASVPVRLLTRSGLTLRVRLVLGPAISDVWLAGEGRIVFRGELFPQ